MNAEATTEATAVTTICDGLEFPEGPIVMPDGSVILVEVRGARLTRVQPDGSKETICSWGDHNADGPNGAAFGPDGALYICNNGGFNWHEFDGMWHPPRSSNWVDPVARLPGWFHRSG